MATIARFYACESQLLCKLAEEERRYVDRIAFANSHVANLAKVSERSYNATGQRRKDGKREGAFRATLFI
jgi:hypothetical protein